MATFGITTTSGYSAGAEGDDIIICNQSYSPEFNGFATSISMYCQQISGEGNICYALYDAANDSLIAQTAEVAVGTVGWHTASFDDSVQIYKDKNYYITLWFAAEVVNVWQKSVVGGGRYESPVVYDGTYPASISWTDTSYDDEWVIYCTYTPTVFKITNNISSTSIYLDMPTALLESTTKTVQNLVFNDGTDVQLDRGKTGDSLTLSGTEISTATEKMEDLNSLMNNQRIITIDGLPDTNLNTDYRISNLDFSTDLYDIYHYNITLERVYDRLG